MAAMHNDEGGPVLHALGVGSPTCDKVTFAIKGWHDRAHRRKIHFRRIVGKTEVCDGTFRSPCHDNRRLEILYIGARKWGMRAAAKYKT
jgi:hypothetical protein